YHPDSGLFSGGNLVLRSANNIIGDAHYWSGGTFQIEQLDSNPGSWLSPNDPVIRANGDVSFDSYVGASLHIFAGGSVKVTGDIEITGADATNGIQETVTLSDRTTVVNIDGKNVPTLDIRAGTTAVGTPGLTGNPTPINLNSTNTPSSADITINGSIINQGGLVFLTNQYDPNPDLQGNITAKQISVPNYNPGGNGGNIHLDSKGTVDVLGGNNLGTFALGTFPNGVDQNRNMGNGGNITVLAQKNISIASQLTNPGHGAINTSAFTNDANATAGNTGGVKLTSAEGNITVNGGIFTNSTADKGGISGDAGDITLQALQGEISVIGNDNGALVTMTRNVNNNNLNGIGQTGDAGNITVQAKGNISITSDLTNLFNGAINASAFTNTANATAGNSGSVQITSSDGDITVTGGILTQSIADQGGISGNTGDITLQALQGDISVTGNENGVLVTTTRNFNAINFNDLKDSGQTGDAGNITVQAQTITLNNSNNTNGRNNFSLLDITSQSSRGGQSGKITFESQNPLNLARLTIGTDANDGQVGDIEINAPSLTLDDTVITTTTFGSAIAGEVNLNITDELRIVNKGKITTTVNDDATEDGGIINIQARTLELSSGAEIFAKTGTGDAGEINLIITDQVKIDDSMISTEVNIGAPGNGGSINIQTRTLDLNNGAELFATTLGIGQGGQINLSVTEMVQINDSTISTEVNPGATGNGGNINIEAGRLDLSNGATIFAETSSFGNAGNISLTTGLLSVTDSTKISASTSSTGMGGNLTVNANNSVTLSGDGQLSAETSGSGIAGNVEITTPTLNLNGRTQVSTTTTSTDNTATGGNLTVNANTLNLSGAETGILAETRGAANAGNLILNPHSGDDLQVNFTEGANISASTSGNGTGGDLEVSAPNSVTLSGNGQLSSEATQGGSEAGKLEITTNQLTLQDSASATVSSTGNGTAGNLTVNASSVLLDDQAKLTATTEEGSGGNIQLQNLSSLQLSNTSEISASTESGTGGDVTIQATGGTVTLTGNSRLASEANNGGNAGKLDIAANQLTLQDGASATVSSTGNGTAGNLTVNAPSVLLDNQAKLTATTEEGSGGNIQLQNLSSLQLSNTSEISASTESGTGGDVTIQATGGTVTLTGNSRLASEANNGGNAGKLDIAANQLTLQDGASATVSSTGNGTAGNLTVNTPSVFLDNQAKLTATTQTGSGGNIQLQNLSSLQLRDRSEISASTQTGQAGSINLNQQGNPAASVSLNNSSISAQAEREGGNAGGINLHTSQLNLANAASILASNVSANQGGDITLRGLDTLQVIESLISTSTQTGQAGSINLNQADNPAASVTLNNSSISAQAEGEGGNAGGINLNTSQLSLANAAQILASNVSANQGGDITLRGLEKLEVTRSLISTSTQTGQAGNVTVGVSESVNLSGTLTNGSGGILAEASDGGDAGGIQINTQQLSIEEGARVAVSSDNGNGIAGDVSISASGINLDNGHISAETDGGGSTNPANISLNNINTLDLTNNSSISASTQTGQAGSINLNQADNRGASVNLNQSRISAQAEGEGGNAGGINLNTSQLNLANAAEILASNVSANQGGDITIRGLDTLQVNQSLISTSTQTGQAGSVTVGAFDSVNLSGTLTNGNGGILAEATDGGSAGNVTITATQVKIEDGAQVTVSSPSGQAGNLSITADTLNLNRGKLTAITGGNGSQLGANIHLELADALFLSNESLISAAAIGEANGGNITINLTSEEGIFVAFPATGANGSDIIAKAEGGNGGRIDITSNLGLYGIRERQAIDGNRTNDIDASSDFGISGQITINSLAIDPSQGLSELPIDTAAPQLDQTCSPSGSGRNEFTVTGRDGLPPSPTDMLSSQRAMADLGTVVNEQQTRGRGDAETRGSEQQTRGRGDAGTRGREVSYQIRVNHPRFDKTAKPCRDVACNVSTGWDITGVSVPDLVSGQISFASPQPLVEAQGWIIDSQGNVMLTADVPTANNQGAWQPQPSCQN
ncbi:MAG: S-layer family protein, partial [Symploca sp. SIO2E6]|nr:S-layer family protein [Symploca sp. SIO2E6]